MRMPSSRRLQDELRLTPEQAKLIRAIGHTMQSNSKPTRKDFADFVWERYSLKTNEFRFWPDEPGRYSTNRIEDGSGSEDPHGEFLADYDVRVECQRLSPSVPVGNFGLKSIDQ
jgi:hypothetical protein